MFLGDGLVFMEDTTPSGESFHKAVRGAVAPAFGARATDRLGSEFVRGADGAVQLLRQRCAAGGGAAVEAGPRVCAHCSA